MKKRCIKNLREAGLTDEDAMEKGRTFENGFRASEEFPEYIDHFFYFPMNSDAETAAASLRERGWSTRVELGADDTDWVLWATQPARGDEDMNDIYSDMDALATKFNGIDDGYGRPMDEGDFVQ
jgi:hypothetical protein